MEPQSSPGNLFGEFGGMLELFKLPGLNAASVLDARRKDIEALVEANRIAIAGAQALAQKQAEILQQTFQELQAVVREGRVTGNGVAQTPSQIVDLLPKTLQQAIGNMRDLAVLACKSQAEAFSVVSSRVQRNVEDLPMLLLSRNA